MPNRLVACSVVLLSIPMAACTSTALSAPPSKTTLAPRPPDPPTPNLLSNSGFDQGKDLHGLAQDFAAWGASRVSLTTASAVPGTWSQSVTLGPGTTGGVFSQVHVSADTPYTQSAYIDVVSLQTAASAVMILEWYDSGLKLVGYQMDRLNITGGGFDRRVQTVRSPSNASLARFVVNVMGGGQVLVDGPQLQSGTTASPFHLTAPNP